ncbi:MAG TPA: hypothetical protein VJ831_04625 [Jatrophihabitantaceae bacterium]|nr:hypothetical protein [Jatrophihabitantaceae bacterium]
MKHVGQLLRWSPYRRGTWQYALLYTVSFAVVATVVLLIQGFDLMAWLGAMTGTAIVGGIVIALALHRRGQPFPR